MLVLKRRIEDGNTTIGDLYINGEFVCFVLEDEGREVKVPGETRIPAGLYKIGKRKYGRFYESYLKRWDYDPAPFDFVPEILDVPGFTDILIHTGNNEKHTAGCLLVGERQNIDSMTISKSRLAYYALWKKLNTMFNHGEVVMLLITDEVLTCKL